MKQNVFFNGVELTVYYHTVPGEQAPRENGQPISPDIDPENEIEEVYMGVVDVTPFFVGTTIEDDILEELK